MRRITIWITATVAVVALVIAYQLNAAGIGGKEGDSDGSHGLQPSSSAPASAGSTDSTKTDDGPGRNDDTGKPGENK